MSFELGHRFSFSNALYSEEIQDKQERTIFTELYPKQYQVLLKENTKKKSDNLGYSTNYCVK